jgi:hypothetical protein
VALQFDEGLVVDVLEPGERDGSVAGCEVDLPQELLR